MSGAGQAGKPPSVPPAGADPSMEDILASIRRILSEDETPDRPREAAARPAPPPSPPAGDVLALDESMLVQEPPAPPAPPSPHAAPEPAASPLVALGSFMTAPTQPDIAPVQATPPPDAAPAPPDAFAAHRAPAFVPFVDQETAMDEIPPEPAAPAHLVDRHAGYLAAPPLVGPETAAKASASLGTLLRTLAVDRQTPVHRGGPTLEDMVREELRPMLKQWLDGNLPEMVERIVRAEIERMAGRAGP